MPLLRLAAGVEHSSLARQNLCLDDIDLAATLLAPQPRTRAPPDGQNLVGLDSDLYPSMCRDSLPGNLYPAPNLVLKCQPRPGTNPRSRLTQLHSAASGPGKSLGSHQNFSGFIRVRLWPRKQNSCTSLGLFASTPTNCSCCAMIAPFRCRPRLLKPC